MIKKHILFPVIALSIVTAAFLFYMPAFKGCEKNELGYVCIYHAKIAGLNAVPPMSSSQDIAFQVMDSSEVFSVWTSWQMAWRTEHPDLEAIEAKNQHIFEQQEHQKEIDNAYAQQQLHAAKFVSSDDKQP